jgi:hypothetical protein
MYKEQGDKTKEGVKISEEGRDLVPKIKSYIILPQRQKSIKSYIILPQRQKSPLALELTLGKGDLMWEEKSMTLV